MTKRTIFVLWALLFLGYFTLSSFGQEIGQDAPPLRIAKWIKGEAIDQFKEDHIYVVEFWGTWCPPCRQSIPHLTKIQKKFSGDVTIIGISGEEIPVVEEFVQAMGSVMDYRVAIDRSNLSSAVYMSAFSVRGIPHAFIVHKGKITWHGHPLAGLDKELSRLIQPAPQAGTPTQTVPGVRKSGGETTGVAQKLSGSTTSNVLAGGFVPRDTTIKKGKYVIAGMFHIPAGVTMTIEPGTILAFKQHMGFYVEGTLVARGTAQQPILMTGQEKIRGFWFGVNFHNSDNYKNILEYVTIEYGGSDPPAFGIPANLSLTTNTTVGSRVSINNCTLRESAGLGLSCCIQAVLPSFKNNTITGNSNGACWADAQAVQYLDSSSSFKGNDKDYVYTGGNIWTSQRWHALDIPYLITGNGNVPGGLNVNPGMILTINSGAQLVFQQNKGMSIGGALKARGTGSAPVLFTGEVKQNGSWGGVLFYNTNHVDNVLDHVVIEYGGGGEILANLVLVTNKQYEPVHMKIINSTIRHSGKMGIWVCEWGSISIGNVRYSNNLQDNYWGPPPK